MDRNTLLAFFLIALVLIFTPKYMEMVAPLPDQSDTPTETIIEKETQQDDEQSGINEQGVVVPAVKSKEKPSLPVVGEKQITIETELYKAIVSSGGGGSILSFSFKNYFDHDSQRVNLINSLNQENLSIRFKDLNGESISLSEPWEYTSSFSGGAIYEAETLVFSTSLSPGKSIEKTLTFHPDTYIIDISVNTTDISDQIFAGVYSLGWYGGLTSTEENLTDDQIYFMSYVYQGGELVDLKVGQGESDVQNFNGATDWVAVRTKYFITSLIPDNPNNVTAASMGGSFGDREAYDVSLALPASETSSLSLYLGPLEYNRIKEVGRDLERVMNFGWSFIRPISKGVLFVLKKMHDYIPNYGFILILFAVGVKILVYPLTKKSYQSTAAMQKIQPELMALRDKFKNNPQKLQQAQMQLYKEKGVNPLGGCVPMLLQMPLLFALFQVFRTTIELRAEPFIWWIKDLSVPDAVFTLPFSIPIYGAHVAILPILMVVSMYIQQRMMTGGAAQQPQQKTMQYFMTGFFFLIFNSFPSGLNLYYTLFNVLTIAQQKLIPPTETITA